MTDGAERVAPRLRPLGIAEILDASIKVCVRHAGTLIKAVLFVVVPVQLVSAVILASTMPQASFGDASSVPADQVDAAYVAGQIVTQLLLAVSLLLATGACFHAIAEAWLGRRPDWRESLRFAARKALPLLWVSVLYFLGILVGALALFVGAIVVGVYWSLAYPVVLVEDVRGRKALFRSFRLIQDHFWRSLGLLAVGYILTTIIAAILGGVLGILLVVNDTVGFFVLVTTISNIISSLITTPFLAAVVTLMYFDLRVRKEGLDIELLAERLGGGGEAELAGVPGYVPAPEATAQERAQAPYWPPPPGWTPPQAGPDVPPETSEPGAR